MRFFLITSVGISFIILFSGTEILRFFIVLVLPFTMFIDFDAVELSKVFLIAPIKRYKINEIFLKNFTTFFFL